MKKPKDLPEIIIDEASTIGNELNRLVKVRAEKALIIAQQLMIQRKANGYVWMRKNKESRFINPKDINKYLEDGYIKTR